MAVQLADDDSGAPLPRKLSGDKAARQYVFSADGAKRIRAPRLPLTAGYGADDQKRLGTAGNRVR